MKQIWIIHGGDSYPSYDAYFQALETTVVDYERLKPKARWSQWLPGQIKDADVLTPEFPNRQNAQFDEWALYFEKLIPFFSNDVCLVGHSLGAMFLAKYLHHNPLSSPVEKIILLAGGYDHETTEGYGSFLVTSATGLEKSAHEIHLFHSEDDPVVPYSELDKFVHDLPASIIHRFTDRHHFIDATFPELLTVIKQK